MIRPQPISFIWTGTEMVPMDRYRPMCARQFTIGQECHLIPMEPRSSATHAHYFAVVNDGWNNLPEAMAAKFPTSEHLRRWCLIKAGFCDEHKIVCESKRIAREVGTLARALDGYAVITIHETVVTIYTAKSQSVRVMDKDEFQKSKQAVLEIISEMIGTAPETLSDNAGQSA